MSMSMEEVREAFAEGVAYVTDERWVAPSDIPDPILAAAYARIVDLATELDEACREFESSLYHGESREYDESA